MSFLSDLITVFTSSVTGFASALGSGILNAFKSVATVEYEVSRLPGVDTILNTADDVVTLGLQLSNVGIIVVVAISLMVSLGLFYSSVKLLKLRR